MKPPATDMSDTALLRRIEALRRMADKNHNALNEISPAGLRTMCEDTANQLEAMMTERTKCRSTTSAE